MRRRKKCPVCGLSGSGPYSRWAKEPRYRPYYYFAHKANGKISWCYLGKLSNLEVVSAPILEDLENTQDFRDEGGDPSDRHRPE